MCEGRWTGGGEEERGEGGMGMGNGREEELVMSR